MSGDSSPEKDGTIRQAPGELAGSQELSLPHDADQHPEAPAIAGYLLTRPIGRGAFAQVWKAFQLRTRRWVAVKVFLDQDRFNMAMLKREEELLVRLDKHPHVVALLDADLSGSPPFFAMELIESGSLEAECGARRPDAGRVFEWFEQMARALAFVHAKGLIHCDLKPANVLLDEEGRVRVADFGQAQAVSRCSGALGTLFYMAPEQAVAAGEAASPDVRWDVYALGATVYALLTGAAPHAETLGGEVTAAPTLDGRLGVYRAAVERDEKGLRGLESVDEDLAAIVLRCLRFDPARRYQSASEVLADLDARRRGLPVSGLAHLRGYRARKFLRRNFAATAVAALAAAGLALSGVQIVRERDAMRRQLAVSYAARSQQAAEVGDLGAAALYAAESNRLSPSRQARANALALLAGLAIPSAALPGQLAGVSADGRFVLAAQEGMARLYGPGGRIAGPPLPHPEAISAGALSADGRRALLGGEGGTARIWDAVSGAPLSPLLRHDGPVVAARFSPDGRWAATGSEDGFSRLWAAADGASAGAPVGLGGHVHGVYFSPDSSVLFSVSEEGRAARLARVPSGEPFGRVIRSEGKIYGADFSPDGAAVATASSDGTARLWSARDGSPIGAAMRHQGRVLKVVFSPDGRMAATASWDETARLWDARTGGPIGRPLRHDGNVKDVAFSPDGRRVLTGSEDRTARVWDAANGAPLGRVMRHFGTVSAVQYAGGLSLTQSPDRVQAWSAGAERAAGAPAPAAETNAGLRAADAVLARSPAGRALRSAGIAAAALSRDGRFLVTAGRDSNARLWDAATGALLGKPMTHDSAVNAAVISPDGKWLASAGDDHAVRLWRVPSTKRMPEHTLRHRGRVLSVAVSPAADRILSGDDAGDVRLWDAAGGASIGRLMRNDAAVVATAFSPDGRTLVSAGGNAARLWDASSGMSLGAPLRHDGLVVSVVFAPDGRSLSTVSRDGSVRHWPLPWLEGEAPAERLAEQAQAATAQFIDSDGELQRLDIRRWERAARSLKP